MWKFDFSKLKSRIYSQEACETKCVGEIVKCSWRPKLWPLSFSFLTFAAIIIQAFCGAHFGRHISLRGSFITVHICATCDWCLRLMAAICKNQQWGGSPTSPLLFVLPCSARTSSPPPCWHQSAVAPAGKTALLVYNTPDRVWKASSLNTGVQLQSLLSSSTTCMILKLHLLREILHLCVGGCPCVCVCDGGVHWTSENIFVKIKRVGTFFDLVALFSETVKVGHHMRCAASFTPNNSGDRSVQFECLVSVHICWVVLWHSELLTTV